MIELSGVTFGYGDRMILANLSLAVGRGELLGVLGPNGAGKSTLARLTLGLLSPRSGIVRLGGEAIAGRGRREIARRAAALLQEETAAFPMTAKECVLLGRVAHLHAHGFETRTDLAAAEDAMDKVGVRDLAERLLHELSGGERRRVLLARAFAQGAPALVLDEPAANLDLHHQLELFVRLRERAAAGAAILVTIHDLNLAARFCDRIALLDGRGHATIGVPDEVLTVERLRDAFGVELERGRTAGGLTYYVPIVSR
jgi:iron complex transport system ATP-binding protein